jgi:hypothetical protein
MEGVTPNKYAYMLKMNGCGHCTNTLAAMETLYAKHHDLPPFYAATSDDLAATKPFLPRAEDRKQLSDVSGFPALFLIKNNAIVKSVLGSQNVEQLHSFLRS